VPEILAASEDLLECLAAEYRAAAAEEQRQAAELNAEAELYERLVLGLERDARWLDEQVRG
jgi:hypothetical protein